MITCICKGGLGNQLFQYAAAKSLAQKHQTGLHIYLGEYDKDPKRSFLLKEILSQQNILITKNIPNFSAARKLTSKLQSWNKKHYVQEQNAVSPKEFFNIKSSAILDGYWQNHLFFTEEIKQEIQEEIGPILLKPKNMIAVHLRGGDYISDNKTQKYHGNLGEEYYKSAIEKMTQSVPNAEFHLFSDDPRAFEWEFLIQENIMWMSQGGTLKDFHSMKSYQNYIIANSSYSWWAAFLAMNEESTIIAPKNWFQDKNLRAQNPALTQWKKM